MTHRWEDPMSDEESYLYDIDRVHEIEDDYPERHVMSFMTSDGPDADARREVEEEVSDVVESGEVPGHSAG